MADKIRCKDCEYCKDFRKVGNTRASFSCEHPNQKYILNYFNEHRIQKMPGFLGYGKPYSREVPIKTSPAWCPKKKKEGRK
ncbi:hypothetical protein [uncultured Acetatifactor sp.]|uniref:hypothetical protein n=1 Tax=uncultured Acetatifactor sp. TaxID=1671927 RepID=UPI00260F0430|nr:hypothetical protein [uncultured Acetatifactor sp.]